MAREERKIRLTPVDESGAAPEPVIRLESPDLPVGGKPVRLKVDAAEGVAAQRLEVPASEDYEIRTHQPGIEVLMDVAPVSVDPLEGEWGKPAEHHRNIPWGWFALLGGLLIGGAIWSLSQIRDSQPQADEIVVSTKTVLQDDAQRDRDAGMLIDRIEALTRDFFKTTRVGSLASYVRHPKRVKPLIARSYPDGAIPANPVVRTRVLQPLTLDNRASFWMHSVELQHQETRNLIIEILDSGEPKIDWETLVCYQPMKWDQFARERPAGVSLDFRVYLEPDNFFSHEFADSTVWSCFRLTALDSEETLFGYAKANEPLSVDLIKLLNMNQGAKASVILRLHIPEGLQSRRGVVIEKLLSQRWIYLDPPDAEP